MNHAKDCPCMYCTGRRLGKQIERNQKAKKEASKPESVRLIVESPEDQK